MLLCCIYLAAKVYIFQGKNKKNITKTQKKMLFAQMIPFFVWLTSYFLE